MDTTHLVNREVRQGSLLNPFQYTARESDTETNLYFYRARYYDDSSGRQNEEVHGIGGGGDKIEMLVWRPPRVFVFGMQGQGAVRGGTK